MRKAMTLIDLDSEHVELLPARETLAFNNNWAKVFASTRRWPSTRPRSSRARTARPFRPSLSVRADPCGVASTPGGHATDLPAPGKKG